MALGANIRRLRKARGWTLEQLSEASGVDVGTISALEKRDSKRSEFAVQIADALNVSASSLMGAAEAVPEPAAAAPAEPPTAPRDGDVARALKEIGETLPYLLDEQRDAIIAKIRLQAEENRRNYALFQKRFGVAGIVPDHEVAKHIEARPAQREIPIELAPPPRRQKRKKAKGSGD